MLESVFKLAKLVEELQSEPDQHSFFDFLHDSQCWIERTLSGVLDQSIPLETQEQQMKLMHELKKRQSLVIKVQSMGGKLAEENFGNKDLCAEIRKQIRDIGQKMSDLNEVVQQKMGAGYNQLAEAASIGPAKLCTPDQSLLQQYWQKFRDCRCWISALHYNMTRHCQIDDSQPSPEHKEVRRQRILQKLRKEIDSRSWTVENVRTLGYKLIEENRGNSVLRTDVKDQLGILIEEFNSLQDMAVHLWNDELRTFRCGHTERLDRESSLRRISDQFCSSCWPLASQVQANKLCQDGDRIRRTPVTADNEDTAVEYYKISDRVLRYALKEHNIKLEIRSIEKIKNPVLDKKLFNVYNEMHKKDCVPELLFHGTTRKNAEMIIQNGFKVGNSGMFGAGIYFATDSTKSAQYCRGTGIKSLLLCDVLLGKTMVCDAPKTSLTLEQVRTAGYDSVFARRNSKKKGGVLNDEYIVYRAEQATPRYLIKFGSECSIL
ncbi:hypothetical protein BOX15_Mlig016183g2 [Macrostomum lignano]|uniref:Poly [ADP-ribose] polymerase n=1 Tax=Macrostomum lignano TaxID=282301 RepID=A0A267F3L9_9PLAT|nr:hypothetical protein BOX15_Mlig016183g1 [Macrostomum lignano]PAA79675.1 hypothetical protein BOX15_Mlig016183g2 [Macrostomum lignano]